MYVIIKNIPSNITIDELESYITTVANGRFFQKKGSVSAVKILQLVDRTGRQVERHCLIIVDTETVKKRLIKSISPQAIINGHYFEDGYDASHCSVNEYFIRHWSNDRRGDSFASALAVNKRVSDRRRRGLRIVAQHERTGLKNKEDVHRKMGRI
jgi:hypothetical protein